jgi:SAM-dependent methyltransferase
MRPARLIRSLALGAVALGAVAAVVRHMHGPVGDRGDAQTDIEMGNVWLYDIVSRFLWAPMFRGIANDVASNLETDGRILEVGCGPGHLATRLALIPGTSVTATDIDPRMVERAVANAVRALPPGDQPTFGTADVAHLPFDDGTFDLVVSTFSMHHWADPPAGLAEIARVLKPTGVVLIWDIEPGSPMDHAMSGKSSVPDIAGLTLVSQVPWRWPGPITISRRFELRPAAT